MSELPIEERQKIMRGESKLFEVRVTLKKRGRERLHMQHRYFAIAETAEAARELIQREQIDGDYQILSRDVHRISTYQMESGYSLGDIGRVAK
jgi:hypothetical protein